MTASLPGATSRRRFKNFEIIRLLAAASVIFSHAFLIANGNEAAEPFKRLSGYILGIFGVFTFFIVSGLLVSQSVERSGTALFLWRRFLRVYPAYVVMLLLVFVILGLAFYPDGGIRGLFSENTAQIARHFLYVNVDGQLPGVQLYPVVNPDAAWLPTMFNGALWSLQIEVLCYLGLAAIVAFGWMRAWLCLGIVAASTVVLFLGVGPMLVVNLAYGLPSFFAGALAWLMLKRHRPKAVFAALALAVMLAAIPIHKLLYVFPLPAAYVLAYVGVASRLDLRLPRWVGDPSYGTYLYGWPVEQLVRRQLGATAAWWEVFAISLPIALLLGFASWHVVERWALRHKPKETALSG